MMLPFTYRTSSCKTYYKNPRIAFCDVKSPFKIFEEVDVELGIVDEQASMHDTTDHLLNNYLLKYSNPNIYVENRSMLYSIL